MSSLDLAAETLLDTAACVPVEGAPDSRYRVAPYSTGQAAEIMRVASNHGLKVLIWGGGTHQGIGYPVDPDIVLSTHRLSSIVHWEPDDLTVVVEAGVKVSDLEELLAEKGQTAVMPEMPGEATVGGTIAAGVSGWRRLRFGPTRDRVLEVILATGDGRVVRAGGRLVKNVTGYDIPRLTSGSLGSLGVISQVCLKLWPRGQSFAGVQVANAEEARNVAYRPLALLETDLGTMVYFSGTSEEIDAQATALGGVPVNNPRWPRPLHSPQRISIRVPAALTSEAVKRVQILSGVRYRAAHGVGEIIVGMVEFPRSWLDEARIWAERAGGALVITRGASASDDCDPWGTPPPSVELQRRVKAAFDPMGISNPGRLPGRL